MSDTNERSVASAGSVYERVRECLRTLGASIPLKTDAERQCSRVLNDAMHEIARLRITDTEREAIYRASQYLSQNDVFEGMAEDAAVLRGLLERLGVEK